MTIPLGIFNPAQAAFLLGIAAVLGACLGSFVNCLAWRLANGESVLAGRSHCTSCGHVLGALDLVPVASWLALRGRCRHCGQRVSPRYVIVEALVAALFAAVVARYGLSVQTAAYLVLVCILMAVALVDLDTFIIPNGFVVAGCVLWLVSIWFMPAPRVDAFSVGSLFSGWVHPGGAVALDGIVGAAVVAGGVLVLSVAFDKVTKRRSLGGGFCFDAVDIYTDYDCFDELVEFVEKAGKVLPDSRELFREMAAICEERSEYERSVIIYNKLIDKDPYSLQDWFSLAKVEALLKHYDKAVEACDFALAVKENEESIISFKGYCYYDSGQYEKAIEQFLEYESITKEKSVAYELIGECYVKLDDNNNALKFFHKALDIEPSNSNICYQLATCYYELGDIQKAVVYLRDTLSLDSRDDEAHSFLGEILLQEGDYEEAYYHLSKSLELNEDDMETMKLKGEACLHLEYYEEAVSVFETVLREDSYDLHCRLKLALAYAKMGDDANAERQIQIIDQMSQSADFSGLPNEKSQQWKNVHGAIQSLKRFLLDHIDDSENKESLS